MVLRDFPERFIARFPELIGRKVLVALSGGADSVALLHLLRNETLGLDLEAAHVHHGVRGEEADRDAAFCAQLCAQLDVSFHLLYADTVAPLSSGREGTWRSLRYRSLLNLKREEGFDAIATGHHRDDVAEGVLVQLLRGGGPRALSGIEAATGEGVVRPLLAWSRGEIRTWLEEREISWHEDSSNLDLGLLRNRVRHDLLPDLEKVSPSLRKHLVHLADTLAADEAHFSAQLATRARWIDPWEPDGGVPTAAIRCLPSVLRTRWLHAQAARIGLRRVSRRQASLFNELIEEGQPRAVTLGRRWRIRLAGSLLWLEPPAGAEPYDHLLEFDEPVHLPMPGWRVQLVRDATQGPDTRWSYSPPAGVDLRVRSVASEDAVEIDDKPVRATKMLARNLPRHLRSVWPVFCEGDRIYWIPGVWQDPALASRDGHIVEVIRCEQIAGGI